MAKDGQLCNPLRLDFLRGTTKRATRTLPRMHTLRTTLALLALASCAAFAAPGTSYPSIANKTEEAISPRAFLSAKFVVPEPSYSIQIGPKDSAVARERMVEERERHERFLKFVRANIAAGQKGAEETPAYLTITGAEWLNLFALAGGPREDAMALWAKYVSTPHKHIESAIRSAAESSPDAELSNACKTLLPALDQIRKGKMKDSQKEVLKAFVKNFG